MENNPESKNRDTELDLVIRQAAIKAGMVRLPEPTDFSLRPKTNGLLALEEVMRPQPDW